MTKEEKLILINNAIEEYKKTHKSFRKLSKEFGISANTISEYIKNAGIEVIEQPHSKTSIFKLALEELNLKSIEEVAVKYNIIPEVLEKSRTLRPNQLKQYQINCAIKEYLNTDGYHRSINKISEKYGINRKTLVKYLKEANIEITRKNDFANCWEEAFDIIDTEEKAYWLGFMYADGYITEKNYTIGLSLSVKDMEHVRKFNNFLKFEHGLNIVTSHQFGSNSIYGKDGNIIQQCTTNINNKHLWQTLYDKGCVPNKSLILTFPDENIFVSEDLIRHFIRGYFDGGGTLGKYQHPKSNRSLECSLMFVGTKDMLEHIQKYLGQGFLMQKSNCGPLTYRLGYSTNKAKKAANIMYKDSIVYLQRKYDIYIKDFAS